VQSRISQLSLICHLALRSKLSQIRTSVRWDSDYSGSKLFQWKTIIERADNLSEHEHCNASFPLATGALRNCWKLTLYEDHVEWEMRIASGKDVSVNALKEISNDRHAREYMTHDVFSLFLACSSYICLHLKKFTQWVNNFLTRSSNKFYLSDHIRQW